MRPPTHLGWTLPGLYPTIQNRGGHVTLYTRLPTVILFSCPQGSLGTIEARVLSMELSEGEVVGNY